MARGSNLARPGGLPISLYLAAALLGVTLALALRVRPVDLAEIDLRALWAFVTAALLEGGLAFGAYRGWFAPDIVGPVANALVIVLIVFGLWRNLHLRSMWFIGLGLLCNTLVIWTNGGHMPVSAGALEQVGLGEMLAGLQSRSDAVHSLMQPGTPLWFLGDIIPVHVWGYQNVMSLGDLYLMMGIVTIILEGSLAAKHKREAESFEFELEF